jgi:hypothetical protein
VSTNRGRVLAHEEAIGRHAQCVEIICVRGRVVGVALVGGAKVEEEGLGGEIGEGEGRESFPGEARGALEVSGAEVDEEGACVRVADQDVVALDVSVRGVGGMERGEGMSDVCQEPEELRRGEFLLLGPGVEGGALDPLDDEVGVLHSGGMAPEAMAEEAGDTGVSEAREQGHLASEASIPGVEGELECDRARVLLADAEGAIDGAVAALAVALHHAPVAHLSARGEQG